MTEFADARSKRPTALKALIFLLVVGLVGFGLAAFALSQRSEEGPKVPVAEPQPLSVTVADVINQPSFQLEETFSGIATASRESELGFTTGGRIDRLAVDVGDRVSRGQVLAVLDTRNLRAQLRAAEASEEEAEASRAIAETTQMRQQALLDQGHVSAQRVDEAAAQTQAAAARVLAAAAQSDTLRVQIDLSTITAPFDGVITARFADEGVIAGAGSPVFRLVETGPMEATIGVPAAVAARLEEGETYDLIAGDRTVSAVLQSVTGVIDTRARTVATRFEVDGADAIPSGTVLRLSLSQTVDERGTWVPLAALTEVSRGVWSVLVAEADGKGSSANRWLARPRPVTIIHTDGDRAYVRGVLQDGDRVILDGLQRITPNQPVLPREGAYAGQPSSAVQ